MNKKLLASLVIAGLCMASAAGATPMTEFHKGQGQIDLGAWQHTGKYDSSPELDFGNKWGFNGGVTYGIAEKWGIQYAYHNLNVGNASIDGSWGDFKTSLDGNQHELNVLYSFDPNAAVYAGWNRIHIDGDASGTVYNDSFRNITGGSTNNVAQLGIVAKTAIAKNLDLYGNFAVGTKSTLMGEAGLGYAFTPEWELNAGYRYLKTDFDDKMEWKGFLVGVTYKFGKAKEAKMEEIEKPVKEAPAVAEPTPAPAVTQAAPNDYYLNSIHFDFDKDDIRADQVANMQNFIAVAKANPSHTYKLVGNTDGMGSNAYNDDLSKRRVDNVYAYAKNAGIPTSQMVTIYKGKNNPAQTNDTEAGRAANRRVDIYEHK